MTAGAGGSAATSSGAGEACANAPFGAADAVQVLAGLDMPLAVFADDASLRYCNAAFLQLMGRAEGAQPTASTFGIAPGATTDGSGTIALGDSSVTYSRRALPGIGTLCTIEGETAVPKDDLTGLVTRTRFMEAVTENLRAALAHGSTPALLMIDLDRFKPVNDSLGHPVGDALLRKVAERLRASTRAEDVVARLGGDEFAVLQTGRMQPEGAEALARRIVEIVSRPYVLDGHMIEIGVSVGVALAPRDASDTEELVKRADLALYDAKTGGRGRHRFFAETMNDDMERRRALDGDMRRALAYRQFELHYQPQQSLSDGRVTGFEALLRWNHPEKGQVPPGDFIPLAEETGFIVPLGEWVIRQAAKDAAAWPEPYAVAVNVSCRQLCDAGLVPAVEAGLKAAGLPPSRFEIEVTESVLMDEGDTCLDNLRALQGLGVRVSLDDFGTGYSSISYLRRFPFDKIKIDQSFVRGPDAGDHEALVRAIVDLGRHFRMEAVAEGVETPAQAEAMRQSGCGAVQGYLVSRPVRAPEAAAMIARGFAPVAPVAPPALEEDAQAEPVSTGPLRRLVYFSRNAVDALESDLDALVRSILDVARRNNATAGVTGALLFSRGHFAQVLEGSPEAVEATFERIQLDRRHTGVNLVEYVDIAERAFGSWAMAFTGGDTATVPALAGETLDLTGIDGSAMVDMLTRLLDEEDRYRAAA